MAAPWIGPLISGASNLVSGLLGKKSSDKAREQSMLFANRQMEQQEEFAKKGIRWKVNDARKAGIHPLYALGAQTTSYAPVAFSDSGDQSLPDAMSRMGQDVSRAVNATRTAAERKEAAVRTALELENAGLQNELLRTRIRVLGQQGNPPFPGGGNYALPGQSVSDQPLAPDVAKASKRPSDPQDIRLGGLRIQAPPGWSSGQEVEDAGGELAGNIYSMPWIAAALFHNLTSAYKRRFYSIRRNEGR